MVALRERAPKLMTLAEFLDWTPPNRTGAAYQLIDGVPVPMAPASENHAALVAEIGRLMGNHLLQTASPCRLLGQPAIVPGTRADWNFRLPDLGVTCSPPSGGLMVQDPLLLIEVLSPSNDDDTRANIEAYTSISSMREILAVHSRRVEAEILRRRPDGTWSDAAEIITGGGTVLLESIGFTSPLTAFYRTTSLAS